MKSVNVRRVALSVLFPCAGAFLFAQWSATQPSPADLSHVPLHLPPTQAFRDQASALLTPQATTTVTSAVNAASFQNTHAPGSLSILYGTDLALPEPTTIVTSVRANGVDAPILRSSPTQMTIQIPRELPTGSIELTLRRQGQTVASHSVNLAQYAPGLFSVSGTGQGRAVAEDASGVAITDSHLAVPGSMVTLYATGLGPTTPPSYTGEIPTYPLPTAVTPVVNIGGRQATGVLAQLTNTSLGLYKVAFMLPAATAPGEQPVFLQLGAFASNAVSIPVQGGLGPMPPSSDSVTISSSSGASHTFTAIVSDPNGVNDLSWAQLLIASASNGGTNPFCFIHYDRSGNGLWLFSEEGFFRGPVTPGTLSAALRNKFCAVQTSGVSFTALGSQLTLNLPVTFKTDYPHPENMYLRAYDRSELDTGMVQHGSVSIATKIVPPLSMTPSDGTGAAQTFTAIFPDAPGFTGLQLGWAQMLFANTMGPHPANCLVHYDRAGNGLWLYGDSGFFLGPVTPGTPGSTLQNKACTVDTAGTTAISMGGYLEWKLPVFFTYYLAGYGYLNLRTLDPIGVDTGFRWAGSWNYDTSPAPFDVTPASGTGGQQVFTARFWDPDPTSPIKTEQILLATAPDMGGQPGCLIHYDRAGNMLWLSNDSINFVGPGAPGSAGTLHIGQCTLDLASASASDSGNLRFLSAAVSFHDGIPSALKSYLRATEVMGPYSYDTGYVERGSWNPLAIGTANLPATAVPARQGSNGPTPRMQE
ncbi:MAG: hypothetical protein J0H49_14310 [Acidobacteria bacterium]|nr:hypothetical protein [Acidobacteriota bacterium]